MAIPQQIYTGDQPQNQTPPDDPRSDTSLQTLKSIFQILVALSLTKGATIFFANGGNQLQAPILVSDHKWGWGWGFGSVLFFAFAFTLIKMAHGYSVYLSDNYGRNANWFVEKGVRPAFDFVILFIQSAVFFILSLSLNFDPNPKANDALGFFVVILVLFAIDVLWGISNILLDPKQPSMETLGRQARNVKGHILYNTVMVVVTALLLIFTEYLGYIPQQVGSWLLVIALLVRSIYDIVWEYDRLFPGAFKRSKDDRLAIQAVTSG